MTVQRPLADQLALGESVTATHIGGGLAVLSGIFVARPEPRISAPPEPKGAPPPKPVAPST
jgi:hypothetical protein